MLVKQGKECALFAHDAGRGLVKGRDAHDAGSVGKAGALMLMMLMMLAVGW